MGDTTADLLAKALGTATDPIVQARVKDALNAERRRVEKAERKANREDQRAEREKREAQLAEAKERVKAADESVLAMNAKIKKMQADADHARVEHDAAMKQRDEEISKLKTANETLRSSNGKLQTSKERIADELRDCEIKAAGAVKQLNDADEALKRERKRAEEAEKMLGDAQKKIIALQEQQDAKKDEE